MHYYTEQHVYVIQAMPTAGKSSLMRAHPSLFFDLESVEKTGMTREQRIEAGTQAINRIGHERIIVTSGEVQGPHVSILARVVMTTAVGLQRWKDRESRADAKGKAPLEKWWSWCPAYPSYHPEDCVRTAWIKITDNYTFLSDIAIVQRLIQMQEDGQSISQFVKSAKSVGLGVADMSKYNQWEGVRYVNRIAQ